MVKVSRSGSAWSSFNTRKCSVMALPGYNQAYSWSTVATRCLIGVMFNMSRQAIQSSHTYNMEGQEV